MSVQCHDEDTECRQEARRFYRDAFRLLNAAGVPYLVGGAYALEYYSGIDRFTKDLDLFVRPRDCRPVLDLFAEAGHATELAFPHWLGKVLHGPVLIDVIFSSGNGVAVVDDDWFVHAPACHVLGEPVLITPAEEMIWSKGFIMERERFDGADIAHIFRARAGELDWRRLLDRFDQHWRVLFSHLILFGFIYPGERHRIPRWVLAEMVDRLADEMDSAPRQSDLCQGTLLSREQYLPDIEEWGYRDARRRPDGPMSSEAIARWTEAIDSQK